MLESQPRDVGTSAVQVGRIRQRCGSFPEHVAADRVRSLAFYTPVQKTSRKAAPHCITDFEKCARHQKRLETVSNIRFV